MNNNQNSITDFRYLDVTHPIDRYQIEQGLLGLGTDPNVINWFFSQVDEIRSEYTKQLLTCRNRRKALNGPQPEPQQTYIQ